MSDLDKCAFWAEIELSCKPSTKWRWNLFLERTLLIRRLIFAEGILFAKWIRIPVAMVVSASGGIGVVVVSHRFSRRQLRSPDQPPLSAASPRELIYNAHLGNTKGLLSSSRFNVFSPRVVVAARCPFYTLFRRPASLPPSPVSFFPSPLAPYVFFFRTGDLSRCSSTFSSFVVFLLCRLVFSCNFQRSIVNRVISLFCIDNKFWLRRCKDWSKLNIR